MYAKYANRLDTMTVYDNPYEGTQNTPYNDSDTLQKVQRLLKEAGYPGDAVTDSITILQDNGILFTEKTSSERGVPIPDPDPTDEYPEGWHPATESQQDAGVEETDSERIERRQKEFEWRQRREMDYNTRTFVLTQAIATRTETDNSRGIVQAAREYLSFLSEDTTAIEDESPVVNYNGSILNWKGRNYVEQDAATVKESPESIAQRNYQATQRDYQAGFDAGVRSQKRVCRVEHESHQRGQEHRPWWGV